MSDLKKFDHYLCDDGPAALVIREHLMPVEGVDGVSAAGVSEIGDLVHGFAEGVICRHTETIREALFQGSL